MASSPTWQIDGCVWPEVTGACKLTAQNPAPQSSSKSLTATSKLIEDKPLHEDQREFEADDRVETSSLQEKSPVSNACKQLSENLGFTGRKRGRGRFRTVSQIHDFEIAAQLEESLTSSSSSKKPHPRHKNREVYLQNEKQVGNWRSGNGYERDGGVCCSRLKSFQREATMRLLPHVRNSNNNMCDSENIDGNFFANQWFNARDSPWPNGSSENISVFSNTHSRQVGYSVQQSCLSSADQKSTVRKANPLKSSVECAGKVAVYSKNPLPAEVEAVGEVSLGDVTDLKASSGIFIASAFEDSENNQVKAADGGLQSQASIDFNVLPPEQLALLQNNGASVVRKETNISRKDRLSQLEECDSCSPEEQADCVKEDVSAKPEQGESRGLETTQLDCSEEDVYSFFESKLPPLEQLDIQVNRVLRVMIDILHPDARSMQGWLGIDCNKFYQICAFYSKVQFESLNDLMLTKADETLIELLLEQLVWQYRSLVVPRLAEKALLAENDIDFTKLDLDLYNYEDLDIYKEIAMLSRLAEDLRNIPVVCFKDENEWLLQYQSIKDISDALDCNDRRRLVELGVVDTAKRVSERLLLGMDVSSEEVMELLRDSMKSGFGEYTWLIENHPELINNLEHFEHIMENILQMAKCIDIRPLRRTLSVIPRFLSMLDADDLESCVVKYTGKYESLDYGQSWVELIRNGEGIEDISFKLTARFFFCSVNCGAEELLGALLENVPLEKKIMTIKSIDCMPHHLRSTLIPSCCQAVECGLYSAIRRMVEEMPLSHFKTNATFLIRNLCEFCSLSPSMLMSEMLFPLISSSAKGKAAVAISSLLNHNKFKNEIITGSTLSLSDLLSVALELYEPPLSNAYASKYLFIETLLRAVNSILRENRESVKMDINAVFAKNKAIKWYQKFVILNLFFDRDVFSNENIEYPWQDSDNKDDIWLYHEISMMLTSWPGEHPELLMEFLCENFEPQDAELLSRSMLLALDRGGGYLNKYLHIFAQSIQKLCHDERDWERYFLEGRYKYQEHSYVQAFDCTGISFGFFAYSSQEEGSRQIINDADLDGAVEFLGNTASFRTASTLSVDGCRSKNVFTTATQYLDDFVFAEGESGTLPGKDFSHLCDERNKHLPAFTERAEDLVGVFKTDVISCSHIRTPTNDTDATNSEECITALLREICETLSESWPATSQNEAISNDNRLCATSSIPPINCLERECVREKESRSQDSVDEVSDIIQYLQSSSISEQVEPAKVSKVSKLNALMEDADVCLSSDWDQPSFEEEADQKDVISDLRTFTWALDTVEDWDNCPTSVKCKVMLLASGSRCDVIRERARQINEASIGC